MSDRNKVLLGVQKALARTGAPVTLTRKIIGRDPSNPTKVTTIVTDYTLTGILYPQTRYEPSIATTVTRTLFIPDLLSVEDTRAPGVKINTLDNITWRSQLGDEIAQDGRRYKLMENEQPMLVGEVVACLHQATIL